MLENLAAFDEKVSKILFDFSAAHPLFNKLATWSGIYLIYLIPIVLLVLWFWNRKTKLMVLYMTVSGLFAWMGVAKLLAKIIGRSRPQGFTRVQELLFHRPDFSFPSDHASFLLALVTTAFLFKFHRLGWFLLILSILILAGRVFTGFHFIGDVVVGAAIGVVVVSAFWLIRDLLNFVLFERIIAIFRKVGL